MRFNAASVFVALCLAFHACAAFGQTERQALGSISGVVVDAASGEPIRNVVISVRRPGGYRYIKTKTDGSGMFLARDLHPGQHALSVADPKAYLRPHGEIQVDVGRGEDIKGLKIALSLPGVISGKVVDEVGDPMVRVHVEAGRISLGNDGPAFNGGGSATTDDRGEFRIAMLEPGRYAVDAKSWNHWGTGEIEWQPSPDDPEGKRLEMTYRLTYYPSSPSLATAILTDVASGKEASGLQIQMTPRRAVSIRGRVTGIPEGGTRAAMPSLHPLSEGPPFEDYLPSLIDHLGNFAFRGVPPGEYLLSAHADEPPGTDRIGWLKLRVADSSLDDVHLHLHAGATVRGEVTFDDSDERGDIRPSVSLHPMDNPFVQRSGSVVENRLEINGVPPARYQVLASAHDRTGQTRSYFLSELRIEGVPQEKHELTIGDTPPRDLEIVLAPSARISGIVLDKTGNPASGAVVLLASEPGNWASIRLSATTDQRGGFAMQNYLPGERVLYAVDRFEPDADDPEALKQLLQGKGTKLKVEKAGDHQVELKLVERK